jgi:large subunit ribosomal protein L32
MAVPKKKTSKSKKNKRKTNWKNKAFKQVLRAFSLANVQK